MCARILPLFLSLGILFSPSVNASGCQRQCGDIIVPYPFGLGNPECYYDSSFMLTCNETSSPAKLLYGKQLPIVDISVDAGTASSENYVAFTCFDDSGNPTTNWDGAVNLEGSPFTFSSSNTTFKVIGCSALGLISGNDEDEFTTGCYSSCNNKDEDSVRKYFRHLIISTHNCSGVSCCQTPIRNNLKSLHIRMENTDNFSCSYGFLGPETFTVQENPEGFLYYVAELDWDIGNQRCDTAKHICGPNAKCINSQNGQGYHCSCKDGFEGNPYERTGCSDIDECSEQNKYTCHGNCENTSGNYTCHCSFPHAGDGKVGCRLGTVAKVMIGIGSGILIAACVFPQCWMYKRRRQESNQRKNGGLFLKHLSVKIYREAQLEKATNSYNRENLLGEGGYGSVYKGSDDQTEIAVKKSKIINEDQIEQFLNEVEIVSKINHKNVVKLLGICLETKVPMLVYEFVSNGTLFHHIHRKGTSILYSWPLCLKIIAETAGALDYMHSLANPPIIHRDIKTANILLDGEYTAKVADFGASKLIPLDKTIAPTRGQGTMGYLDPEYLQTGELTVKSDVYGFGVVLMELLSKEKPLYRGLSGEMISLVQLFTSAVKDNRLDQLLKISDVSERGMEQVHTVAKLAVKCVRMPSTDRPTMTEVADVLNGLSKEYHSFHVQERGVDQVNLLGDQEILTTSVSLDIERSAATYTFSTMFSNIS